MRAIEIIEDEWSIGARKEPRKPVFNFGTQAPGLQDCEGANAKDESGAILRSYSTRGHGIHLLNTAYNYIDLLPKGRDESGRAGCSKRLSILAYRFGGIA